MPSGPQHNDDLDRDSFYVSTEETDDDDYELEPVDPTILEAERRQAEAEVVRAQTSLQIDKINEQVQVTPDASTEAAPFRFQFQTKHLLYAVTALAIFIAIVQVTKSAIAAVIMIGFAGVLGAHAYFAWRDNARMKHLSAKREELLELSRTGEKAMEGEAADSHLGPSIYDAGHDQPLAPDKPKLKINFSTKQLLIAMTVAALGFAALSWMGAGGLGALAALLGVVALAGLAVFAIGLPVSPALILGWWVVVALFVFVSVGSVFVAD